MEEKKRRLTLVGAITLVAVCVFVSTAVRAVWYAPEPEIQIAMEESVYASGAAGQPTRLIIPALGIDTSVEKVGLNAKGNMAAPSNYVDVGWYKYGARPGEQGSAVIAGHLNNGLGLDGVFMNLEDMKKGDDIVIETIEGKQLRFVVTDIASYEYTEVPVETLFNRDDTARLNLVTCEGVWVGDEKTYDRRLVVYAVLTEADQK